MTTTEGMVRQALGDLDTRLEHWRETLVALCRIPGVSAAGFPPDEVRRSAQAVAQALRGAGVENVEVQGLHQPLHSGYSGPVPDPVQILCTMIADLRKPNGALNVPGLYARVARPGARQLARIRKLRLSEAKFKKDAGMLPGVRLWGETQYSLLERQWTRPALTVIALEARPFLGSTNQIIEAARARLSLRTVPGMDAREGAG